MIRTLLIVSLFLNIFFLFHSWREQIVVSVPDGDSLQLADGRRVRLLGIDAPEKGRCMAEEARRTLNIASLGRHVRLKNIATDDYGRQLDNVIVEDFPIWISYLTQRFITHVPLNPDPYINRMMVFRGLARSSSGFKMEQNVAKAQKLGIWSDTCRKTSNPDCSIKGNIRAGQKTFLLPDCPNYDQTIIDESFGDEWFCTEKDAIATGFTKAAGCTKN